MTGLLAYFVFFATIATIYAIIVMGLNIQWGFTGLFNAGVVGFYAIGAYACAILTGPARDTLIGGFGMPFLVGLAGAALAAALAGLVVALITLRLSEEYLAIATFGIGLTVQLVALNAAGLTGGANGLYGLPRPFWSLFDSVQAFNLFYLVFVVVIGLLVWALLARLVRSPWGRLLRAIREDDVAARSLGKNPVSVRVQSFVIGSAIMGTAGALYTGYVGFISPIDFIPILTFQIWAMLIVGGSGSLLGGVIGSFVIWLIWTGSGTLLSRLAPPDLQAQSSAVQVVLIGLIIVLTILIRPRGLIGEKSAVSSKK
ncbi:branched-chain amino acid ABC transporter permease [Pseudooceanicola sp. HF7]|uniref:branched-chain amino acid ABC transporter permease n=1 Tax=Pseudooceanicola sp. HF7 TaxID=2721560 RepID=UPI00142FC562|nr:branched-chain amino acid ABC transporter permease [Pseudooceanicola sp. HF7]NIZ10594.1 branched-chain amino acid ABC transporter permease [Pseudooceanicola sp. HF7]